MLKKFILVVSISIFSFGMDYNLKPIKIAPNVWQFVGKTEAVTKANGGNIANTYWIQTKKHWIVIDSGATFLYAKQSYKLMKEIASLPIKFVINTHTHDDHWLGNSYYTKQNIPIYATKLQESTYKKGDSTRILNILNKKDLVGTTIGDIDKIIDKNFVANIDGTMLEFIKSPETTHTKDDLIVYLPKQSVLFTGDILMSQRLTSIRHGSIEGSLKVIEMFEKMKPKIYANGHGKYIDDTGLQLTKSYLEDLKTNALKAIEDDIDLDDFIKQTKMPKYKEYFLYNIAHKENLATAFKEYEFFGE